MLKVNPSYIILVSILLVVSTASSFAQTVNPNGSSSITVTTDKPSYNDGDQITVSGTVSSILNVPISIIIKDPSQNVVEIGQVTVNSDNTYSTPLVAGGRLWTATGTYEVDVTYGSVSNTAKTTFEFTSKISGIPSNMSGTANQTVPEFGPTVFIILVISMFAFVFYSRIRHGFKAR